MAILWQILATYTICVCLKFMSVRYLVSENNMKGKILRWGLVIGGLRWSLACMSTFLSSSYRSQLNSSLNTAISIIVTSPDRGDESTPQVFAIRTPVRIPINPPRCREKN